jgi:xylulokinase
MARGYFIGLDAGTSGVKSIAVDARGRLLASASSALTLQAPKPGWAEQDPDAWWRAAVSSLKALQGDRRLEGMRPEALGLSGQMHSSVFLDEAGKVIRPALLWCDGRTTAQCRAITKKLGEPRLRQWVSNPALEGFTLPKVLWLRETEPAAFRRLRSVLLAKDYLRYKLSGVLATDYSDAAGTLMLDVAKRRWSAELLKALKLDASLLPSLGESSEILSVVSAAGAKASGLPQGLPIAGGGADNACGAVGVGAVTPGTAVASWGTSGTVLAPLARPKVDPGLRAHTFCSAVPGQWYVMGVMLSAGASFAWYRDQLRGGEGSLRLNQEAAGIAPGADGLTFLPYLSGERTPHRDASARGALVGLSLSHSKAHVSRAVLEGICFGLRDAVEILRGLKLPLRSILLTGGGAKSPLLRRLQADIYGIPVQTVDKEEGPAYGAALLGMVGVGAHKSVAAACQATLKRSAPLKPVPSTHQAYATPYARFRSLYPALKAWAR